MFEADAALDTARQVHFGAGHVPSIQPFIPIQRHIMDTSTNGLDPTQERSGTVSATITEEEASRYDRQMRLWGLEAQQRSARS